MIDVFDDPNYDGGSSVFEMETERTPIQKALDEYWDTKRESNSKLSNLQIKIQRHIDNSDLPLAEKNAIRYKTGLQPQPKQDTTYLKDTQTTEILIHIVNGAGRDEAIKISCNYDEAKIEQVLKITKGTNHSIDSLVRCLKEALGEGTDVFQFIPVQPEMLVTSKKPYTVFGKVEDVATLHYKVIRLEQQVKELQDNQQQLGTQVDESELEIKRLKEYVGIKDNELPIYDRVQIRKKRGMSQAQVAEELDKSVRQIKRYWNEKE